MKNIFKLAIAALLIPATVLASPSSSRQLTGSEILNGSAVITLPTVTGTLCGIAETCSLTNKTFPDASFTLGYYTEGSAPATPPSGKVVLYAKADGLLYSKDDAGTESAVTGGGSGTVTSVAATVPTFLSVSGSPITSSGTLAISLSGVALPIANGGTGQNTAAAAINALVPSQAGNTGKVLKTDGSVVSWTSAASGTVTSVDATVPSFLSVSGNPITSSGTLVIDYSGTALPIANGGTGQTSAANAINALVPTQTGNSGKFLTTNGSAVSWATAGGSSILANNTYLQGYDTGPVARNLIGVDNSDQVNVGTASLSQTNIFAGTSWLYIGGGFGGVQLPDVGAEFLAELDKFTLAVINVGTAPTLSFQAGNAGNFARIKAPSSLSASYTLTLPPDDGSANQYLKTDGSGGLAWDTVSASPAGSSGAIQFNNSGSFGADSSNLFWDDTNNRIGLGTNAPTSDLHISASGNNPLLVETSYGTGLVNVMTLMSQGNTALTMKNQNTPNGMIFGNSGGATTNWQFANLDSGGQVIFYNNGGSRITLDSSGNVSFTPATRSTFSNGVRISSLSAGAAVADGSGDISSVAPGTSGNVLTSNGTTWISAPNSGGGASTALDNLASVAVNANITPATDLDVSMGSASKRWDGVYTNIIRSDGMAVMDVSNRQLLDPTPDVVMDFSTTTGGSNNKGVLDFRKEIEFNDFSISNFYIRTANNPGGTSQGIILETGFGTGGGSGDLYFRSGSGDSAVSGSVNINTGDGGASDIASGAIFLTTGNVTGTAASGDISFLTGTSVDGTTGNVTVSIPAPSGSGVRGQFLIQDGSEGSTGNVWTSTDNNGRGAWAAPKSGWKKVTKTFADFTDAGNTKTLNIEPFNAGYILVGYGYNVTTVFSGGSSTLVELSVVAGAQGNQTTFDVFTALVDLISPSANVVEPLTGVSGNLQLTLISTGDTLDNLTQGSVDFYYKVENVNY